MSGQTSARPVAMVSGGGAGIGRAVAQRMAEAGYDVVIADRDGAAARSVCDSLAGQHLAVVCDVAEEASVAAAMAEVLDTFGRIDLLVNNAGIGAAHVPMLQQELADFERQLRVHVVGTFLLSRAALAPMTRQRSGSIVNLASIAGLSGLPRRNGYSAAKAAIVQMTRAMAAEVGPQGIRVNAVAPGYVQTALVQQLLEGGSLDHDRLVRRTPLGRLARPEEIAEAIHFLASPQAGFITGVVLPVDGGWTAFGDAGDAYPLDEVVDHAV